MIGNTFRKRSQNEDDEMGDDDNGNEEHRHKRRRIETSESAPMLHILPPTQQSTDDSMKMTDPNVDDEARVIPFKMHFSLVPLTLFSALAAASNIQVNYYSDGGCAITLTAVYPFTNNNCYNYDYTGINSALIANCSFAIGYICTLYSNYDCNGFTHTIGIRTNDDSAHYASAWGVGFRSMRCGKFI